MLGKSLTMPEKKKKTEISYDYSVAPSSLLNIVYYLCPWYQTQHLCIFHMANVR